MRKAACARVVKIKGIIDFNSLTSSLIQKSRDFAIAKQYNWTLTDDKFPFISMWGWMT